ncbi:MAG TPA: permease-like cell division protein FtsX [Methylomirabilota bacterium]|nr:permease-like cell division protein FtsX [Methylomirabilota bacterium]
MLSFLASEAARDLRRAGRVGLSAILLITLSLGALGCFWLLSLNLDQAVSQWRERVRVVAYLREEPRAAAVDDFVARVQALEGVQRVRFVSRAEALSVLKRSLGTQASVVDQLPRNPLPASIEVTPTPAAATPDGTRGLSQRLAALPEVDEVQGGAEWVESLAQWQRLFELTGLGVGAVLALAAILTVTTATTLVLHARRDEMEIMRLVGATEAVIRLPVLLQGMAQGLLGAAVALVALVAAHTVLAPRVEPLLTLTLGLQRAVFLSSPQMVLLLTGGALLGALGGLLAKGRAYA